MGLLDVLKGIGKVGLNVATGGIAGSILDTAGALAGGRQQGRETDAAFQQRQDQLAQQRYANELAGTRLNLDAPGVRAGQSVRGDILSSAQPFQWSGATKMVGNIPVPQSTGGLNPGIFSPKTRALGAQITDQALADNTAMGGKAIGAPPALTDLPRPNTFDRILQTAGTIGGLAPNFADLLNKYKKPSSTYIDPNDTVGYG